MSGSLSNAPGQELTGTPMMPMHQSHSKVADNMGSNVLVQEKRNLGFGAQRKRGKDARLTGKQIEISRDSRDASLSVLRPYLCLQFVSASAAEAIL